jgi:hypothetical protein
MDGKNILAFSAKIFGMTAVPTLREASKKQTKTLSLTILHFI